MTYTPEQLEANRIRNQKWRAKRKSTIGWVGKQAAMKLKRQQVISAPVPFTTRVENGITIKEYQPQIVSERERIHNLRFPTRSFD